MSIRRFRLPGILALAALILDQVTKAAAMASLPEHGSVPVVEGFLDLVNVRNRGAAFGILNRPDIEWQFWLFAGATLIAAAAIIGLVATAEREDRRLFAGFGLVLGGALGNFVDRVRWRAVVDFLDLHVGEWHWPAFNVADMAICGGAALACLALWRASGTPGGDAPGKGGGQ